MLRHRPFQGADTVTDGAAATVSGRGHLGTGKAGALTEGQVHVAGVSLMTGQVPTFLHLGRVHLRVPCGGKGARQCAAHASLLSGDEHVYKRWNCELRPLFS